MDQAYQRAVANMDQRQPCNQQGTGPIFQQRQLSAAKRKGPQAREETDVVDRFDNRDANDQAGWR